MAVGLNNSMWVTIAQITLMLNYYWVNTKHRIGMDMWSCSPWLWQIWLLSIQHEYVSQLTQCKTLCCCCGEYLFITLDIGLLLVASGASQASIISYDSCRKSLSFKCSATWADTESARKLQYSSKFFAYLAGVFAEAAASCSNCFCNSSGRTNRILMQTTKQPRNPTYPKAPPSIRPVCASNPSSD